jgi:F-type H+-transporting ATPase subunit gamma
MATLRDIKRRIGSIKKTQQITKAMEMVAAARLKRAQDNMMSSRPFSYKIREILRSIATRVDPSSHPLLEVRNGDRVLLIVVTADRGLCGGFNSNVIKKAESFMEDNNKEYNLIIIGRKGRDFFRRRDYDIKNGYIDIFRDLKYEYAVDIANFVVDIYKKREVDKVYIIYNQFKSVIQQIVATDILFPIPPFEIRDGVVPVEFLYEPSKEVLLDKLLIRYVETEIYQVLLESLAGEYGARMSAMRNATNNAQDMIRHLTLKYNKVRQAAITKEIIEVVSGAAALK